MKLITKIKFLQTTVSKGAMPSMEPTEPTDGLKWSATKMEFGGLNTADRIARDPVRTITSSHGEAVLLNAKEVPQDVAYKKQTMMKMMQRQKLPHPHPWVLEMFKCPLSSLDGSIPMQLYLNLNLSPRSRSNPWSK